jgi:hypothetical protein
MTDGPLLSIDCHATANEPAIAALVVIALVVMVMSIVIGRGPRLQPATAVAHQWLQIPFYKRAGFLRDFA